MNSLLRWIFIPGKEYKVGIKPKHKPVRTKRVIWEFVSVRKVEVVKFYPVNSK